MIKVLLADDEWLVRDGLYKNINWKELGMEIVGSVENGNDGIKFMNQHRPELIITDICMPFVDGLEFAEAALNINPNTVVIILSGFDEFEYAKAALKIGVFDYILKPFDLLEFEKLLIKACNKIKEIEKTKVQKLLLEIMHNKKISSEVEPNPIVNKIKDDSLIGITFNLLKFEYIKRVLNQQELWVEINNFLILSRNIMKDLNVVLEEFSEKDGSILYIVSAGKKSVKTIAREINFVLHDEKLIKSEFPVFCGVLEKIENIWELPGIYKQWQEMLEVSYLYEKTILITYSDIVDKDMDILTISQSVDIVSNSLKAFDKDLIQNNLEKCASLIYQTGKNSKFYSQNLVSTVFNSLINLFHELGFDKKIIDEFSEKYRSIYSLKNLNQQIESLKEFLNNACDYVCVNSSNSKSSSIEKAKEYIESNYSDNKISLQMVADVVNMSPTYFSLAFKQAMGTTFITFLTDLRMEKAEYLVKNTSQKSYEICELIGYDNPTYFSTLFKKHTGLSVKDYRTKSYK